MEGRAEVTESTGGRPVEKLLEREFRKGMLIAKPVVWNEEEGIDSRDVERVPWTGPGSQF